MAFTAVPIFNLFFQRTYQIVKNTHTHTHTYIYIYVCVCVCVCVWTYLTVWRFHLYTVTIAVEHFYTNVERVEMLTVIFINGVQAWWLGLGQYLHNPHSKLLTQVPRRDMKHWASPSQYKGQLRCHFNDNWTVSTAFFCSLCLCCFVSEQLIDTDKDRQKAVTSVSIQRWTFCGK
jgi:hypothetical protein